MSAFLYSMQAAFLSSSCEIAGYIMDTVTIQFDFTRYLIKYQYYKNMTFQKLSLSHIRIARFLQNLSSFSGNEWRKS